MITLTDEQINVIRNGYKRVQVTVSFPFDNIPDITNEQIVYESLSFNESVCSSDVFRFGNAEASTVSFETVGVGNILGKVIDVKLTYEYILPEDPTNVRTFDLPYGRFTVTSCPRNHENMAHRQVHATSRTSDTNEVMLPRVEKDKLRVKTYVNDDSTYRPNIWYLIDSIFGRSCEYTDTEFCSLSNYASTETTSHQYFLGTQIENDTVYSYYFDVTETHAVSAMCGADYLGDVCPHRDALYSMEGMYDTYFVDTVDRVLEQYEFEDTYAINIAKLKNLAAFRLHYPFVDDNDINTIDAFNYLGTIEMKDIYGTFGDGFTFQYPLSIDMSLKKRSSSGDVTVRTYSTFNPYAELTVTESVATEERFPLYMSFNHTLENKTAYATQYQFSNAYDVSELAVGIAEVMGGFFRTNRDGTASVINLDGSNPYPLTASDVEGSAWWDEYNISPIGSIKYTYSDKKGDHEAEYPVSDGGSVYDMTDNYFLKNVDLSCKKVSSIGKMVFRSQFYRYGNNWYAFNGTSFVSMGEYHGIQAMFQTVIDTLFKPHMSDIHFTPIDMNIRGLPFLQCGDAITFTAADGTVINSYILNHTFTGIQHITENIDTVQGEVLS